MNLRRPRQRLRYGPLVATCALLLSLAAAGGTAGTASAASTGWRTSGTQILTPSGSPFTITGINWYGFETNGYVAQGMYAKNYPAIIDQIKEYGYNTIRIPFSNAMWEKNPVPRANTISACPACKNSHSRDILARIINYAGSIGLHVILDNHRSTAGNSAESNGLWYVTGGGTSYPEDAWIRDWVEIQRWVHGVQQTRGSQDTVEVNYLADDGFPTVIGFELRNEPHTPPRTAYLKGATWGTGDGVSPTTNANPNPFAPGCVSSSSCHDWRLAAERAGDTLLGAADAKGWSFPLILVNGISQYPTDQGSDANGPYDYYWWGGDLQGVKGTSDENPGAPVRLNVGGSASSLGPSVTTQLVYTAHDFGPEEYKQGYFNAKTCYRTGCSDSSLADVWNKYWAYISSEGVHPIGNTSPYAAAPVLISEFGTSNTSSSLSSETSGSQGQWFKDMVNFIQSSYAPTEKNSSGIGVKDLGWTYWALNAEDGYALLGSGYTGLANAAKEYSFLCRIQRGPLAVSPGSGAGECGSTGPLPVPN